MRITKLYTLCGRTPDKRQVKLDAWLGKKFLVLIKRKCQRGQRPRAANFKPLMQAMNPSGRYEVAGIVGIWLGCRIQARAQPNTFPVPLFICVRTCYLKRSMVASCQDAASEAADTEDSDLGGSDAQSNAEPAVPAPDNALAEAEEVPERPAPDAIVEPPGEEEVIAEEAQSSPDSHPREPFYVLKDGHFVPADKALPLYPPDETNLEAVAAESTERIKELQRKLQILKKHHSELTLDS